MHPDDGDCIVGNLAGLVEGNVLFDRKPHDIFLAAGKTVGMFADVLSWEGMLHDLERTHGRRKLSLLRILLVMTIFKEVKVNNP